MGPARGRAAGSQCVGHSPSRDCAVPLSNAVPRPGRRTSRPLGSKRLGGRRRDAGKFVVAEAPRRLSARARRPDGKQPHGPLGRPPRTHPEVKSCCTLSSRSRRVSSIASPPFRPRAAAATPAPRRRRWAPPPSRRLASSHRSRRAFRVPAPLRAHPARAAAVQRAGQIPAAPKGWAFAGALALSAGWAGRPRAANC